MFTKNHSQQSFAYEIRNGKVTIYRCFSGSDEAVVPAYIEGCPVTNIAPYAFSMHQNPMDLRGKKISEGSESLDPANELPALCGLALVSLVLPDTVERLGRYCLYNCENLKSLEFSGNVKDWGSGTFTGCHRISSMKVHVMDEGKSTLKDILSDIPEEVEVDYEIRSSTSDKVVHTRLMFPEYFEEGIENTPARILETRIHGSGMKYRNCFQQKIFQFQEYDSRFYYAINDEKPRTVIRLAMNRLRFPGQITDEAIQAYENYLIQQAIPAAEYILEVEDMELLGWFVKMLTAKGEGMELLSQIRAMAQKMGRIAAVSFLMDFEHSLKRPKKERRRSSLLILDDEIHSTEARSTEAHSTEAHSTEARSTEAHSTETYSTETYSTEAHSTEAHSTEKKITTAEHENANSLKESLTAENSDPEGSGPDIPRLALSMNSSAAESQSAATQDPAEKKRERRARASRFTL